MLRSKALAITVVVATLLGQAPPTTAAHAGTGAVDIEEREVRDRLFASAVRLRTPDPVGGGLHRAEHADLHTARLRDPAGYGLTHGSGFNQ